MGHTQGGGGTADCARVTALVLCATLVAEQGKASDVLSPSTETAMDTPLYARVTLSPDRFQQWDTAIESARQFGTEVIDEVEATFEDDVVARAQLREASKYGGGLVQVLLCCSDGTITAKSQPIYRLGADVAFKVGSVAGKSRAVVLSSEDQEPEKTRPPVEDKERLCFNGRL